MRAFAVFAERLAMVRGDHDQRPIERVRGAQAVEERAERGVGVGDLSRVRIASVSRGIRLGRRVRFMRIVEMYPGEPRTGFGVRRSAFPVLMFLVLPAPSPQPPLRQYARRQRDHAGV